ncbi:chorismate synthase [Ruminococcus gauvreauii]|uniref:Chorismate synthase n=1 Tax=Ruminococcus gauvreauii TaxID=438033 RepID=A0ABY5VH27_9FIRM|nr:chorismate synthase [Ruminococcus gauvreauii]UWP59835.1 chorismate synthase [Ruminococcus gauvreauii]
MAGSSFGTLFTVTTWGESHGKGLGVVVDGCPSGLLLQESDIQAFLNRRKPGQNKYATPRKEADEVEILSGVFEGRTTGTPISMIVRNTSQRSGDYGEIASYYRPGHADYTFDQKYGFRDYRGGGRSSGRETVGRVAAGAIAVKILNSLGVSICTYTKAIGPITAEQFHPELIAENPLYMPDTDASKRAQAYLDDCMKRHDSSGGVVECIVSHFPAGAGTPVFEKLDACLGKAVLSIGAVKGVEIGDGFAAAEATGLSSNDGFCCNADGHIHKLTNHSGGVLGGISDGSDIILRAAFKPTPSIFSTQQTVNRQGESVDINIKGRHDPIIVPRAVVVVESMTAMTLVDALLCGMGSRMEHLQRIWHPES